MPQALVIRTAGTNCDRELVRAFEMAGADTRRIHLHELIQNPRRLDDFDLIGFPGGFSYGDDVASGRLFAMRVRLHLYPALREAVQRACLIIGVCNGFQVLVQLGLLPGPEATPDGTPALDETPPTQTAALTFNEGGRFIDKWVEVQYPESCCLWTKGLQDGSFAHPDIRRLPIAHGEGRFVTARPEALEHLQQNGRIALRYAHNPNGSQGDIAGICDASGRILGLMPHPERYIQWTHHPYWTRLDGDTRQGTPPGLALFQNAVEAAAGVGAGRG